MVWKRETCCSFIYQFYIYLIEFQQWACSYYNLIGHQESLQLSIKLSIGYLKKIKYPRNFPSPFFLNGDVLISRVYVRFYLLSVSGTYNLNLCGFCGRFHVFVKGGVYLGHTSYLKGSFLGYFSLKLV